MLPPIQGLPFKIAIVTGNQAKVLYNKLLIMEATLTDSGIHQSNTKASQEPYNLMK